TIWTISSRSPGSMQPTTSPSRSSNPSRRKSSITRVAVPSRVSRASTASSVTMSTSHRRVGIRALAPQGERQEILMAACEGPRVFGLQRRHACEQGVLDLDANDLGELSNLRGGLDGGSQQRVARHAGNGPVVFVEPHIEAAQGIRRPHDAVARLHAALACLYLALELLEHWLAVTGGQARERGEEAPGEGIPPQGRPGIRRRAQPRPERRAPVPPSRG